MLSEFPLRINDPGGAVSVDAVNPREGEEPFKISDGRRLEFSGKPGRGSVLLR